MTSSSNEWFADEAYWEANRTFIWTDRQIEMSGLAAGNVAKLLGMRKGESVLDLACGFGRHSFEFHKLGFPVTGVDLNSRLIEEAKLKVGETGNSIRFIRADMREYTEPYSYNYVVLLYNSFGYFKDRHDDERVIRNCFESLLPGGKMLISVMGRKILRRNMNTRKQRYWWEKDGNYRLEEFTVDEDWSWADIKWVLLKGNNQRTFEYGFRIYSEAELVQSLSVAGFCDIQVFGRLKGTPYDEEAQHLVTVSHKPK